jgi:hypothetical protein
MIIDPRSERPSLTSLPIVRCACWAFLDFLAGGARPFARDDHSADTQVAEVLFDGGLAVPTVSGHGARCTTGPALTRSITAPNFGALAGVSDMHFVIDDDAAVVVDDWALYPNSTGLFNRALGDRARIAVMQTDHPAGSIRCDPSDPFGGPARRSWRWPPRAVRNRAPRGRAARELVQCKRRRLHCQATPDGGTAVATGRTAAR